MDRHPDWAVIVCLIGGGQEINTGEAGIGEWITAITRSFPDWHLYVSSRLTDSEYNATETLAALRDYPHVTYQDSLHLAVSMRSFRAEDVSLLIKQLLDLDEEAHETLMRVKQQYPMVVTRNLAAAKQWLKSQARGTERYGMVVSVNSARPLKPRVIVHEAGVSKHEALILDLEHAPSVGIRRSLKPAALPSAAMDFLAPRQRVTYFFERVGDSQMGALA